MAQKEQKSNSQLCREIIQSNPGISAEDAIALLARKGHKDISRSTFYSAKSQMLKKNGNRKAAKNNEVANDKTNLELFVEMLKANPQINVTEARKMLQEKYGRKGNNSGFYAAKRAFLGKKKARAGVAQIRRKKSQVQEQPTDVNLEVALLQRDVRRMKDVSAALLNTLTRILLD